MEEITKDITKTYKTKFYIAQDGKEFEHYYECLSYERELLYKEKIYCQYSSYAGLYVSKIDNEQQYEKLSRFLLDYYKIILPTNKTLPCIILWNKMGGYRFISNEIYKLLVEELDFISPMN